MRRLGHRRRAADVDVARRDVGHQREQALGREAARRSRSAPPRRAGSPARRARRAGSRPLPQRAVDDGDVAGPAGHVLEQRADRRDPDAAGDQRHPRAPPRRRGEGAERPLGDHARAGRDRAQRARVVAEPLDGDPQPAAVGRRRERERVRLPPAVARQEAPREELPGARLQRPEPAALDLDRGDAGASSSTRATRRSCQTLRTSGTPRRKMTSAPSVAT